MPLLLSLEATETVPEPAASLGPEAIGGDFALAQRSDGRLIVGVGPFEHSATPAEEGASFYVNDFQLSDPKPWRIPAAWDELGSLAELATKAELPELDWQEPAYEDFARVFAEIGQELAAERLVKTVPATVARTKTDQAESIALGLIAAAKDPGTSSWLYGFREQGGGFVGLTPERLFRMNTRELTTMALAGTAETGCGETFAHDAKEQCEHHLVVEALRRRLAEFGGVDEGAREIIDVGGMIHFLTRFEVELAEQPEITSVIAALHPTPAVGAVPRTPAALEKLAGFRSELGVPAHFGAPFGVKCGDEFEAFVAIRGIFWDGEDMLLPSGCGVVEASQLDREWEELALKRRWVKSAFGLT